MSKQTFQMFQGKCEDELNLIENSQEMKYWLTSAANFSCKLQDNYTIDQVSSKWETFRSQI